LEVRLLYLASTAHDLMAGPPSPATHMVTGAHSTIDEIGKFAILGAVGPMIPAFSALLVPGQRWVFDTLHQGSPDPARRMVRASSVDFLITLHERVSAALLKATDLDDKARTDRRRALQAYVMGHLCHIATDVISQPYYQEIDWVLAEPGQPKRDMADVEA